MAGSNHDNGTVYTFELAEETAEAIHGIVQLASKFLTKDGKIHIILPPSRITPAWLPHVF